MPTITVEGRRLHYLDEGVGDAPIVFLHTFPLQSLMWEPQLQELARNYRLIAPDLMGFGGSDAPADRDSYTVERWADDVIALVSALHLDRVVLVGLSTGAYVALSLLRRYRNAVGALVLASAQVEPDAPEDQQRRTDEQHWLETEGDVAYLADRLLEGMVGRRSPDRSEVVKRARLFMEGTPLEGWIGGLEALKRRPDFSADLDKIDVPTLVLVGEDDELTPPSVAEAIHDRVPDARLSTVPEAGHLANMENPAGFNTGLWQFLDEAASEPYEPRPGEPFHG
jgi:3-oxoadipate enol-lactonase